MNQNNLVLSCSINMINDFIKKYNIVTNFFYLYPYAKLAIWQHVSKNFVSYYLIITLALLSLQSIFTRLNFLIKHYVYKMNIMLM